MPDDLLPPVDPPDPIGDPAPRRRASLVCEFCDCKLTPVGDVLNVSDKARNFRKLEDRIEILTADLTKAQADLAAAQADLRKLRTPAESPARAGVLGIGRRAGE